MFMKSFGRLLPILTLTIPTIYCAKVNQTYIWGNGVYQARPDALLQFKNFTPKVINNLPNNLTILVFGDYYQGGITEKGQLYIWQKKTIDANYSQKINDNIRENVKLLQKNIKQVKFTTGFIWTLNNKGEVYQWPIIKQFDQNNQIKATKIGNKREVEPLRGTIQLATGQDHILALNSRGEVYAMGDDTLGQCGQPDTTRHTHPPFTQKRVKFPEKNNLPKIAKIACGGNHSLALDQSGNLYGWGSNSTLQLSHQQQFSQMNNPLLCTYNPIKISKGLDNNKILDVVAGEQFSIIITQNNSTSSCQVFSVGSNLKGQLGINQIRHLRDISRIQGISNYFMKVNGESKKIVVKDIKCGDKHCIALLNIGYVMIWGDNQYGQIGNQKRSTILAPVIMKDLMNKQVIGVFAGKNNTGVIIRAQQPKETSKNLN